MGIIRWMTWLGVALLACAGAGGPAGQAQQGDAPAAEAATPAEGAPQPRGGRRATNREAEQARADLAERLKLPTDDVRVVSVVREQVPIGPINCPGTPPAKRTPVAQPAQVVALVITLEANGKQYTYHSYARRLSFCDREG